MTTSEEQAQAIDRAALLIAQARYVVALSGAGISVESGIPPFRGPGGVWTKYGEPDMRGYDRFLADPKAWWQARLRGEGARPEMRSFEAARPNPGHYALAELERMGVLRHIITQNVDNLHYEAGNTKVAEIHGNRAKLRCIACHARFNRDEFTIDEAELPPPCPSCNGVVKGDGVMFGEPIPPDVLQVCRREALTCDCMVVAGTSALVYPAAEMPIIAKVRGASLIEVNLYETDLSRECDVVLRGPSGELLPQLVARVKELVGAGVIKSANT